MERWHFGRSVVEAFEQGRTALMLNGIPEETTPTLLIRPGSDALRVFFVNGNPVNPVLPSIAIEILEAAVTGNTSVNLVRYDGGVAVLAGARQLDCNFDLERAALLEHAVSTMVQLGYLQQTDNDLFQVTQAGYEAAREFSGQPLSTFLKVKEQMPALVAEMKKDLEGKDGKCVREFFVMSNEHILGGSEKHRFIYYEEDHGNLRGKIDILENHGYVEDITPGNTPIHRMSEEFIRLVLERG
jgi:hypothetical protein